MQRLLGFDDPVVALRELFHFDAVAVMVAVFAGAALLGFGGIHGGSGLLQGGRGLRPLLDGGGQGGRRLLRPGSELPELFGARIEFAD